MLFGHFVEGSKRELEIPNIEPRVMKSIVRFIYTGKVQVDIDNAVDIIKAVDQYCIKGAREEFERAAFHYIEKATETEVSVEFILRVMFDAAFVSGDVESLLAATLNFIDNHTPYFFMSNSFFDLNLELLVLIMQRDTLH